MDKYWEAAEIMCHIRNEIGKLREIERQETNPQRKKKIHRRRKELQYQNLWYLDKYDRMWEEEHGSNEKFKVKHEEQKTEIDKKPDHSPDDC